MTHEIKAIVYDAGEAVIIGGGYSYGMAQIMPEMIHGAMVIATGIVTALTVFFLNRYLRNRFPDNNNKK